MVLPCSSIYKDINSEIEFPTLKSKAVEVYLDPMGKVLDNTTRNLYNRDQGNHAIYIMLNQNGMYAELSVVLYFTKVFTGHIMPSSEIEKEITTMYTYKISCIDNNCVFICIKLIYSMFQSFLHVHVKTKDRLHGHNIYM